MITSEHLVPLSKGGNSKVWNLRDCCDKCNGWRGNIPLTLFKHRILNYLNTGAMRRGYSEPDLRNMLISIDKLQEYIYSAGAKLYRPSNGTFTSKGIEKFRNVDLPKPQTALIRKIERRKKVAEKEVKPVQPVKEFNLNDHFHNPQINFHEA